MPFFVRRGKRIVDHTAHGICPDYIIGSADIKIDGNLLRAKANAFSYPSEDEM